MSLIRWHKPEAARAGAVGLQDEMSRLFDDFFTDPWIARSRQDWAPALGISEDPEKVTVTAELPGIDAKDVDISVEQDILTLKGEKREETKRDDEKRRYHYVERSYGSFMRRVRLPARVDSERATASMSNGVLTLHLPKTDAKAQKRIDIKQEG